MKKHNTFIRLEDKDYYDGGEQVALSDVKKAKRDKRKQRRIENAFKTKNIDELLEYEDDLDAYL